MLILNLMPHILRLEKVYVSLCVCFIAQSFMKPTV